MNPLEVFGSVETPKGTFLGKTASFDTKIVKIGRDIFAERVDKKRKKTKTSLYVDILWAGPLQTADDDFWPLSSSPNVMNCVELGSDQSRGFRYFRGLFWPIAIN
jgi:hypothetical protein